MKVILVNMIVKTELVLPLQPNVLVEMAIALMDAITNKILIVVVRFILIV
jgi:hypothetical protein